MRANKRAQIFCENFGRANFLRKFNRDAAVIFRRKIVTLGIFAENSIQVGGLVLVARLERALDIVHHVVQQGPFTRLFAGEPQGPTVAVHFPADDKALAQLQKATGAGGAARAGVHKGAAARAAANKSR